MRNTLYKILLVVLILNPPLIGWADEKIRISSGEWVPYTSETYRHYGLALHIVTEAFRLVDVEVEYGFFPWKRSRVLAKHGDWDATCCWGDHDKFRKDFLFSDTLMDVVNVFFYNRSEGFDWETMPDLKGVTIGGTFGYVYSEAFIKAEADGKITVHRAPTDALNFRKLLAKRIDIFIADREVGYQIIHEIFSPEDAGKFTHHPRFFNKSPHVILFSKKSRKTERLRALFNKGLKLLVESGRYDQFYRESQRGEYRIKESGIAQ